MIVMREYISSVLAPRPPLFRIPLCLENRTHLVRQSRVERDVDRDAPDFGHTQLLRAINSLRVLVVRRDEVEQSRERSRAVRDQILVVEELAGGGGDRPERQRSQCISG